MAKVTRTVLVAVAAAAVAAPVASADVMRPRESMRPADVMRPRESMRPAPWALRGLRDVMRRGDVQRLHDASGHLGSTWSTLVY